MAKPNCTRRTNALANLELDFPAVPAATAPASDAHAVFDANGEPTAWRALSLDEAQQRAEVERKEQAAIQRKRAALQRSTLRMNLGQIADSKARRAECKPERLLTVARSFDSAKQDPAIRLAGQWLACAGFAVGERVRVQVSAGRLVITLEKDGDRNSG